MLSCFFLILVSLLSYKYFYQSYKVQQMPTNSFRCLQNLTLAYKGSIHLFISPFHLKTLYRLQSFNTSMEDNTAAVLELNFKEN